MKLDKMKNRSLKRNKKLILKKEIKKCREKKKKKME